MRNHKTAGRLLLFLGIALLVGQQSSRALPLTTDALRFFNNFFVTGDYVVGGVGLWATGRGTIRMNAPAPPMTAAPEGAEALAAFLYWQVVTSANPTAVNVNAGATFNGVPLNTPTGTQLLPTAAGVAAGTQACQLNGGTGKRVHTFRSDVLRFLDVDRTTGRRVINKADGYPVAMPNNGTTRTLGASLVVIYRHPDPAWPLNAIVMYDGTFVKQQPATLFQRVEGFYDPADVPGQMTYIAGSAQGNLGETLRGPFTTKNGPFVSGAGNAWDNLSVGTNVLPANTTSFDITLTPQSTGALGFLVNDCITMGAMIYRTKVNDSDRDGLLNSWESSPSTLLDPKGVPLPNFKAMGARPDQADIFIEIGAMRAAPGTTYGSAAAPFSSTIERVTDDVGHQHLPTPAALRMLGDSFAAKNIAVHFDVGRPAEYRSRFASTVPDANVADAYLVGGADETLARGGELIDETACTPSGGSASAVNCQFPAYPGTVTWKAGYELYKNRLFDANRKDSFRYVLYAHAKGAPKSLLPCLAGAGGPAAFDETGSCANGADNPSFHVPSGVSGSGEYPGGDFLVTLGLWDNTKFVGSDFVVASTTMHELGHTLNLGHGGTSLPNCKPNYLSVMNYLFQLGGLIDADGVPHLGYSGSPLLAIRETEVSESYNVPGPYRTSWYAPKAPGDTRAPAKRFCNGQKFDPDAPPVPTVRVDGTVGGAIDWNANGRADDVPYPLDVNFDGEPDTVAGGATTTLEGYDDWSNLRLNQVGSRRNFGGISIGPLGVQLLSDGSKLLGDGSVLLADGSVLLADGSVLLADGSVLLADGSVFLADGSVLLADGSVLLADGVQLLSDGSRRLSDGSVLLADGSVLLADGARLLADGSVLLADGSVLLADGSVFLADGSVLLADGVTLLADGSVLLADGSVLLADGATVAWEFAESTPLAAAESGTIPGPNSLKACVIGGSGPSACAAGPAEPLHRVRLTWVQPNAGNVSYYHVYRVVGDTVIAGSEGAPKVVDGSQTFLVDTDELPNGTFTYVVDAVLDEGTVTPRSNSRTIIAENTKPVANSQSIVVWEDWPSDPLIALTGQDPDSAGLAFSVIAGPTAGSLTGVPPTVSYLSAPNYNGADSLTFRLSETSTWNGQNQDSDPGAVALAVTPVNDKPNFTKGPNQVVTQPAGLQTVPSWATGFDAGPPDEDLSQGVLGYIVSNSNAGLFAVQPAIGVGGALTYTPMAGVSGSATVTVQVRDTGGTAEGHGAVDTSDPKTFTITVVAAPLVVATLTSAGPADVWFSNPSTSSTSQSNKYDLKAEVLKNGVVVTSGELKNVNLSYNGTSLSKAVLKVIALLPTTLSPGVPFVAGDTLRLRVSARYVSGTPSTGSLRLWFNTPGAADDTSHLHAKFGGPDIRYHLVGLAPTHSETVFPLQKGTVPSGPVQYVERASLPKVGSTGALTELGTWSITGP